MLGTIWKRYISPMLHRPLRVQIAALCYRHAETGPEILLITSRSTKRWIIPKGWPMHGTDGAGTALQEAWEEAGVKARGPRRPVRIGRYRYDKVLDGGLPVATSVDVYAIEVEKLLDVFPEMQDRERHWMTPERAAAAVHEEQLSALLADLPGYLDDAAKG